jgi:hypothetical protein
VDRVLPSRKSWSRKASEYGVDAPRSLAAAFEERFPNAHLACEAVEDSAFLDRSFEAIIAWGLIFLLPAATQLALLDRTATILTPGGRLLFTSWPHEKTWLDAMTGQQSQSLGTPAYLNQLSKAGLVLLHEYEDEGQNHYYDVLKPR